MQIVPTLNFGGNCREAIQMYEKALPMEDNVDAYDFKETNTKRIL